MSTQFVMPALGESVEEGVITRWLKAVGDAVEADEPLLEVATDKVDTEIPAPCGGVIRELLVEENSTVAVGAPLAIIEAVDNIPAPAAPVSVEPEPEPELPTALVAEAPSGGGGQTTEPDTVPAPAAGVSVAQAMGTSEKMTRLRQTIAKRMVDSLHISAQLTTVVEADISALARLRAQRKDEFFTRTKTKLTFLPFFAKATVEALAAFPMLNASVSADNSEVTYHKSRHLGIAVDSPKGLMVPVIRDASELSIEGLAKAIADVADRTRAGKIGTDELNGGTFTITNTGSRGALFDTPIINQPQTGILGTGAVVDRVVPMSDGFGGHNLAVCSMVYLSITYDHRIVDGADAARFLGAIKDRLGRAEFEADI